MDTLLAKCSDRAYRNIISEEGDILLTHKNISCTVSKKFNMTIVSFRGTDDAFDWITNVSRWKTSFMGMQCKVHSGFLNDMELIYESVLKQINDIYPDIWVTGHSLGGAVAILFATKFAIKNANKFVNVTTFGSPRIGDRKFKSMCDSISNLNARRIHNRYDIVTYLPYFRFFHVGKKIKISSGSFLNPKNAHSIKTYIKKLEQTKEDSISLKDDSIKLIF